MSYLFFGRGVMIFVNFSIGIALIGFMLLFFIFLETTIINMIFKKDDDE